MKLLNITLIVIIIYAAGEAADWFTDCTNKNEIMEAKRQEYQEKKMGVNSHVSIPRCVTNIDMLQQLGLKLGVIYMLASVLTFTLTYFQNRSSNKAFDKLRREKLEELNINLGGEETITETENKVKASKLAEGIEEGVEEGGFINPLFDDLVESELKAGRSTEEALNLAEEGARESSFWKRGFFRIIREV